MKKSFIFTFSSLLILLLLSVQAQPASAATDLNTRMQERINRWVERTETRVATMLDRYCDRFQRYHDRYGSNLPSFCTSTEPTPTPTPTPSPTPSPSPSPSSTSSPSPSPTTTPSPSPSSSPSPSTSPTTGLLITEVYYDVDDTHGSESTNEWVEIYNPTTSAIDLSNYTIEDATSADTIPEGTNIPPNSYLVIIADASTTTFWTIPNTTAIANLESSIGNGLGNDGDLIQLKNSEGSTVDAVSWGSNITAFDPAAPDVAAGSSLGRQNTTTDTDTAADWQELTTPTIGE